MLSLFAKIMFIKLNTYTFYVNFNEHNLFVAYLTYEFCKKRIYDYTNYLYRGIPLHLHQNNLAYHYTGKKYKRNNFYNHINTNGE